MPPRRQSTATAAPRDATDRSARTERLRRAQRFRQRRRDLLADAGIAFFVAITALIIAPGLGVIAIAGVPAFFALVVTVLAERRARKRGYRGRVRPFKRRRSR